LGRGGVQSLSVEFVSEDPCCFVGAEFEAKGLQSEPEEKTGEHQDEESHEFREIPLCFF